MKECERCLMEAVDNNGLCGECGYNHKDNSFEALPEKEVDTSLDDLDKKLDKVKQSKVSQPKISAREEALVEKILDFKYHIDNPSAWESFSQEGSDMLRTLLDIVEERNGLVSEKKPTTGRKVYQEDDDISLKGLLVGQIITDIEGDDIEVKIKTKEHTLHVEAEGSEGSRISCNMKVPVQTIKEVNLSL